MFYKVFQYTERWCERKCGWSVGNLRFRPISTTPPLCAGEIRQKQGAGKQRSWKAKELESKASQPGKRAPAERASRSPSGPSSSPRSSAAAALQFSQRKYIFHSFLFFRGVHHRRCVGLVIGSQILTHTCIFCRNTLHRPSHPFTHQRCSSLAGSGDLMASFSRTRFRKCSLHLVFCTSCEGADVFVVWKKRRARVAP